MKLRFHRSGRADLFEQALHDGKLRDAETDELVAFARALTAHANDVPEPDDRGGRLALQSLVAAETARRTPATPAPPPGRRTGRGAAITVAAVAGAGLLVASAATGGQPLSSVRDVVTGIHPLQLVLPAAPVARDEASVDAVDPEDQPSDSTVTEQQRSGAPDSEDAAPNRDGSASSSGSATGADPAGSPRSPRTDGTESSHGAAPAGEADPAGVPADRTPTPDGDARPRPTEAAPAAESPSSSSSAGDRTPTPHDTAGAPGAVRETPRPAASATPLATRPASSPTPSPDGKVSDKPGTGRPADATPTLTGTVVDSTPNTGKPDVTVRPPTDPTPSPTPTWTPEPTLTPTPTATPTPVFPDADLPGWDGFLLQFLAPEPSDGEGPKPDGGSEHPPGSSDSLTGAGTRDPLPGVR